MADRVIRNRSGQDGRKGREAVWNFAKSDLATSAGKNLRIREETCRAQECAKPLRDLKRDLSWSNFYDTRSHWNLHDPLSGEKSSCRRKIPDYQIWHLQMSSSDLIAYLGKKQLPIKRSAQTPLKRF